MELLDIQIDLFHFKGLLDSIGTENQENTHEQLSGRLLYYIPQFGITECFIQYKCSVKTPPPHTIRSG